MVSGFSFWATITDDGRASLIFVHLKIYHSLWQSLWDHGGSDILLTVATRQLITGKLNHNINDKTHTMCSTWLVIFDLCTPKFWSYGFFTDKQIRWNEPLYGFSIQFFHFQFKVCSHLLQESVDTMVEGPKYHRHAELLRTDCLGGGPHFKFQP